MSIQKLLCLATLAAAPALSQAAATFEQEMLGLGTNDTIATAQNLGTMGLSGFDIFGSRLDALPGTDSVDYYKFTLSQGATVHFSVNTNGGPTLANDPIVGLFNSGGGLIAQDDDGGSAFGRGFDSYMSTALSAGTYFVAVHGYSVFTFVGNGGSTNFAYQLEISNTAPVPEPESYAMLLAGLGLMGAIVRRRSQKSA